tara:strand:- start:532 stop:774 length:243 start_codon:yes stop_codon:yes gene_type:complete
MVLLTLIYTSLFSNAFAQNSDSQADTPKVRTFNFEEREVNGKHNKPDGSHIKENTRAIFNPLVQIRDSFSEEMQNSINNL